MTFLSDNKLSLYSPSAFDLYFFSCQRAHVCVSSAVVQLAPAPCRDLTAGAARCFTLKGPRGWTPAAWAAA